MSTITCQGISKSFGGTQVLDHLDLTVPDRAVVTLVGPSGGGKTTLLRLIAGFERPDAGTISLDDEIVDSADRFTAPDKRRIGFVAQEGNLFPHLTVAKNVGFGLSRSQRAAGRVQQVLELVGLGDLGGRYPHQLSGGQQQRVALARALAPQPRLVLLDEPFSSLDPALRSSLRADVMRILRDQRATTLFVTHDQTEALSSSDLVGVVRDGQVRQLASPDTVYDRPADVGVAQFIGEANLVAGTADHHLVHTALGDLPLASGHGTVVGPSTVLVRPEQIALRRLDHGAGSGQSTGQIVDREYYGHDAVVLIRVEGMPALRARCPGPTTLGVGDLVALSVQGPVLAWPAGTGSVPEGLLGASKA